MLQLPPVFKTKSAQMIHIVAMPLVFFVFMVIYRPFHIEERLMIGKFPFGVHLILLACFIFTSFSIPRAAFTSEIVL